MALLPVFSITPSSAHAATAPVDLGTAAAFSVLGASTVTSTGPTVISTDLGLSPGTAVTGFPPGTVGGTIHAADAAAAQAQTDMAAAYNDAAGRSPATTLAGDIGGTTLAPGVYGSTSSLGITGTLTLDGQGDPGAVFIIQMGSTLTTGSNSTVNLINGAQACNVFWQVGSSATLGTGSTFNGTVLALTSITVTTGVNIAGRVLAHNGAVTLDTNAVNGTACEPGSLSISVPEARSLGSGSADTTITNDLGVVTVDDQRGAGPSDWVATVAATDFTEPGAPHIPAAAMTYTPGAPVSGTGDGVFTPGTAGSLSPTPRTAYSHTDGTGSNRLSWNPLLSIAVPFTAPAGTYTGVLTHSVA
ncbi:ice-binding family protein [Actinomadura sp. DC4]|uniref:ice-binding family protein n=1 Tax=Actinomadura sp. DC4 TaxID=3055069 RepID=UPI0025B1DFA7|nr:ice-binding family protein [Actinomadura sp. DC4]MDN3351578.1 ice-binding family protein [Actinomadura sp. DC4]